MTNKEWLNRGFNLSREIEALQSALETAQQEVNDSEYIRELYKTIADKQYIQKEILMAINQVDKANPKSLIRTILIERYLNYKPIEVIAWEQHYSPRWVQKLLKAGEDMIIQE